MADRSVAHHAAGGVALPRTATHPVVVSPGSPTRLRRRSSIGSVLRRRLPGRPHVVVAPRTGVPRQARNLVVAVSASRVRDRRSCRPGRRRARVLIPLPAVRTPGGRRCRPVAAVPGSRARSPRPHRRPHRRSRVFLPAAPTAPGTASRWPTVSGRHSSHSRHSSRRRTPGPARCRPVGVPCREVRVRSRGVPARRNRTRRSRGRRVTWRTG